MARSPLADLRRLAVATSLETPTDLAGAIDALGFVQADPIRAPARAQDLILRQRVAKYRVGDLERRYPSLTLEEDFLYAYGFMPRRLLTLLHPRPAALDGFALDLMAFVKARPVTHPRDLEADFGKQRAVNGWGGFSKATTQALQNLHHAGHLRIAGRQNGIRLYAPAPDPPDPAPPEERSHAVMLAVLRILAPISMVSLGSTWSLARRKSPGLIPLAEVVARLRSAGEIATTTIDGESYLTLADRPPPPPEPADRVRILAPFDPIVWDRRRFDHLWGWRYRFEAYGPADQRKLGYYAMPLLWRDDVIGWANGVEAEGATKITTHFTASRPPGRNFTAALDREIDRIDRFLTSKSSPLG